MTKCILVTGGAGFIAPQFIKLMLINTDWHILVLDKLTYAGNKQNLAMIEDEARSKGASNIDSRVKFIHGDICDMTIKGLIEAFDVDYIANFAAESHVDRSIGAADDFLRTEIHGTFNLLETIRAVNEKTKQIESCVFVSTDEVYGSIDRTSGKEGKDWYDLAKDHDELRKHIKKYHFREEFPVQPGSPYASTKAAADLLVLSYVNTHRGIIPACITRGVNNYGPFQHPEKLLPLAICTLIQPVVNGFKRRIPIYDNGLAVREWMHTEDYASAVLKVLKDGKPGEIYNVGSGSRCLNVDLLIAVFKAVKKVAGTNFTSLKEACFEAARAGHDLCYAIDDTKMRNTGWTSIHSNLKDEIEALVQWYHDNPGWWQRIWESPQFDQYWRGKYQHRMEKYDQDIKSGEDPLEDFHDHMDKHWNRSLKDILL